jgi:hypothetical protein
MRLSWSHDPCHKLNEFTWVDSSYFFVIFVACAPHNVDGDICLLILRSRYPVFDSGLLGNPSVLVFVRDSGVRGLVMARKGISTSNALYLR